MKSQPIKLTYRIQIDEEETFILPESLVNSIGAGNWLVTIEQITPDTHFNPLREYQALLNGYSPDDEGLYDDYPTK